MNLQQVKESIERYLRDGCPPGGCLEAILRNDLSEAFGRADAETRDLMFEIVQFVYDEVPTGARREHVNQWLVDESYRTAVMEARDAFGDTPV